MAKFDFALFAARYSASRSAFYDKPIILVQSGPACADLLRKTKVRFQNE